MKKWFRYICYYYVLFSFLLKLNSHHLYTFTSLWQQTLKRNYRASHNCYSVKNMLKLLAFKWRVIAWDRIIRGHVNPVICLSSNSPCNFDFARKSVPFPSKDIIIIAVFFSVFFSESYHLFLSFAFFALIKL